MRVHHVALRVTDVERSLAFYAGLLGLQELQREPRAGGGGWRTAWLQAGGAVLMLETELKLAAGPRGSGHVLAFAVDDLGAWELRLSARGVRVEERTAHTLYVRDPDGHRVGLSCYPLLPVVDHPA